MTGKGRAIFVIIKVSGKTSSHNFHKVSWIKGKQSYFA